MSKDYQSPIEMWREEKKKRQEAEGELTIIKGIGNNSPEMKALEKRVKELDNSLSISLEINDQYQREVKEVKEDNQKLALQISDLEKKIRRIQSEH
jgi:chromosome segregation ATPase